MARNGHGKAHQMTAPWPDIPWTPPPPTERDQQIADEAARLWATGEYPCYVAAVEAAEKLVAA